MSPHTVLRAFRAVASLALVSFGLSACATLDGGSQEAGIVHHSPETVARYGARPDERFPLPATDISKVDKRWLRQEVSYIGSEAPGTIVIDTGSRVLYLVGEGGRAMRYGIGVGKEGLAFEGEARVGRKAEWPRWTPTRDMMAREPERYGGFSGGVDGGLENPLGPRALYLYQGDRDTLFRIHGTTEPWTIGKAVSSGCIRLLNQDIIDLYNRVPVNAQVVVYQHDSGPEVAGAPRGSDAPDDDRSWRERVYDDA